MATRCSAAWPRARALGPRRVDPGAAARVAARPRAGRRSAGGAVGLDDRVAARQPSALDLDLDHVARARRAAIRRACPVRITSPGSSVMNRDRSATRSSNGKSRFAVESSWTTSPLTSVRSVSAAGSSPSARRPAPDRREAVLPLGQQVRAPVGPAHVVHARRRSRRVPADVRAGAPRPSRFARASDDHGHLALEREQLGALRPDDRVAVGASDEGGLRKYDGRPGIGPAARPWRRSSGGRR